MALKTRARKLPSMKAALGDHRLTLRPDGTPGRFSATLPDGAAGQWCRLAVSVAADGTAWWVKLEAADAARGHVVREAFLGRERGFSGRSWRTTLVHLPHGAGRITIQVFTALPGGMEAPVAALGVLSRRRAAIALLAFGWPALPRALAGNVRGMAGRVRAILGQHPARAGEAPPYRVWIALYDDAARAHAALRHTPGAGLPIGVAVVGGSHAEQTATLASLHAQSLAPARIDVIDRPTAPAGGAWVLVMQAGEILAPDGLDCFAEAVRRFPDAAGFYADCDSITQEGRAAPLFKPHADPWLLRTGLLTRGACLFRAAALQRAAAGSQTGGAAAWRTDAAASLAGDFRGIPLVLTHVPGPQSTAVNAPVPAGGTPLLSLVIPTSAQRGHMLHCLRAVLARTDYPALEILLAVSRVDPHDRGQAANLAAASAFPFVRVLDLQMPAFNYAAVNNAAARHARGELLLLLNDDVVPLDRCWLRRMVAFVAGTFHAQADIVGARLLYGNGLVQHGGVTMGLANLCEHSFRLSGRHRPGPHGLALLNRQVSAVTGACMLVRHSLFETLGGMDEAFAIALNDVDFCLRAGQAGARIVFAAEVALIHHESLSLGRHYEGGRAHLEAIEVRRLRARWPDAIANDPFYSPAASLEPGREFQPGFPPRVTPESWCSRMAPGPFLTQS